MSEQVYLNTGFKNIPINIELNQFKNSKGFPYQGLWLFSGSQGFGKSLTLMGVLREMHAQYPDARIISNISIFGLPCEPYQGVEDFNKSNGADGIIYVIDEIHTLFNSLESKSMPLSTVQVWCQNRKNRRVILGTSQRFTRVAKPIREQCNLHYECLRPFFGIIRRYRVLDGSCYDDSGRYISNDGRYPRPHWYIPSFNVLTGYNTLEVVKRNEYKEDDY